jgi:hypothetical protein
MLFSGSARLSTGKDNETMIDTKARGLDQPSYELASISAPIGDVAFYRETYRLLGWRISTGQSLTRSDRVTLHLMRHSSKAARPELSEIQLQAEGAMQKLSVIDRARSHKSKVVGVSVAAAGSALSGLGLFALIGPFALIPLLIGIIPLFWWPIGVVTARLTRTLSQSRSAAAAEEQFHIITSCGRRAQEILP